MTDQAQPGVVTYRSAIDEKANRITTRSVTIPDDEGQSEVTTIALLVGRRDGPRACSRGLVAFLPALLPQPLARRRSHRLVRAGAVRDVPGVARSLRQPSAALLRHVK